MITDRGLSSARASVSVEGAFGGFTIQNIMVRDMGGKVRFTMPLSAQRRPLITLRGEIKQTVQAAIWRAYCASPGGAKKITLMTDIEE